MRRARVTTKEDVNTVIRVSREAQSSRGGKSTNEKGCLVVASLDPSPGEGGK